MAYKSLIAFLQAGLQGLPMQVFSGSHFVVFFIHLDILT